MAQQTQLHDHKGDDWNVVAAEYTKITNKTSLAPIGLMLSRADALHPFSQATAILDNGCGPGPVMSRIIEDYGASLPADCKLTCSDFSEGMIGQVKNTKEQAGADSLWAKVETKIQNAMDLTEVPDDSQSHMTAGMVYFMTPDPLKCLTESHRVLKVGGVLSVSAWEGSQWLDLMSVLSEVRPDKAVPSMPEAWRSAKGIEGELKKAGFQGVETHECPVEMPFQTYESMVGFFVTKLPHMVALTKDMTEEEIEKLKALMIEKMAEMAPTEPGHLQGVALVGVGRK